MKPLVSIIIPTYNRAHVIRRALQSILDQTYSNWEVIIVDNCSDDGTDEVVDGINDERIRVLKVRNGGVVASSRNMGVEHSRGKYIAFLDSDDWWKKNKLEESLRYLEKGIDVVYHDLHIVSKEDQMLFWRSAKTRVLKGVVYEDLLCNGNALNNSSVVVRSSVFRNIGRFSEDPNLISAEDFDGWLRMARYTNKFKRIPKVLGYYWNGGGNISNSELTLKSIEEIEKCYAHDIEKITETRNISWTEYTRGKSYYQMGNYRRAIECFRNAVVRRSNINIMIKSLIMMMMCHLKYDG